MQLQSFAYTESSKIKPIQQKAKINDTVQILCLFAYPISWKFNGSKPLPNSIYTPWSPTLVINQVVPSNEGYYECEHRISKTKKEVARSLLLVIGKTH